MHHPLIRHCNLCGSPVEHRIPAGDSLLRAVCPRCDHIQYENPRTIVGTIPAWGDQVLLCRRAIEPRHGLWTLPAGFMELNETSLAGALRETDEEAGATVDIDDLYCVINVRPVSQIYLLYRARLRAPVWNPGPETLEAGLFSAADLPWDQLAFRSVAETLRRYFTQQREGQFSLQQFDIA